MSECMALSIIQRIAGALSVLGGLHIFWRAWKRKRLPFDRIMLGLSTHTILWGIYNLWGTAAIPTGTPNIYGAHGTTTTCTIQGFLFQVSMVVPFYYVFLSCYSWVVILHGNFDPAKYGWIEKYIHLGVHVFPLASAIYLLTIEAFNPNGLHCWIASIPADCGDDSGIECIRGPSNPHKILWIFGGMPAVFFLLFPTTIMVLLTYCVCRRKQKGVIPCVMSASMVARQSAVYLGSLYWVYLPLFVYNGQIQLGNDVPFGISLWVNLVTKSMGMWFAIVYWYFTAEDNTHNDDNDKDKDSDNENDNDNDNDEHNFNSDGTKTTKDASALPPTTTIATDGLDVIGEGAPSNEKRDKYDDDDDEPSILFSTIAKIKNKHKNYKNKKTYKTSRYGRSKTMSDITESESVSMPMTTRSTMTRGTSRRKSLTKRFSFNIFDGTASSGPGMFSNFVFDGDSEDEEKDLAESKQWENCQEMIND